MVPDCVNKCIYIYDVQLILENMFWSAIKLSTAMKPIMASMAARLPCSYNPSPIYDACVTLNKLIIVFPERTHYLIRSPVF
jgi:hypothetical protein